MIAASFSPNSENQIAPSVHKTSIAGLYYMPHKVFSDDRGFYKETARIPEIESVIGKPFSIQQLNQSRSQTNVIRGFHAESWNKLITVTTGHCFCALLDVRVDSLTFGKVETFYLGTSSESLQGSIFVSNGIANSLCAVEGPVDYCYAVDALWINRDPAGDVAIALFDPDIPVTWPVPKEKFIFSQRDAESISLAEYRKQHS